LTLDRVILHTVMHHSSTSTYLHTEFHWNRRNFFVDGRTDNLTNGRTFETHFIRSTRRSRPKNNAKLRLNTLTSSELRAQTILHHATRRLSELVAPPPQH